jgi:uncharacterized protein (DUF1501 family)
VNRRSFIKGASVLALGFAMPAVLERAVFARALDGVSAASVDRTLVVIELNGGIDGLNVVIPLNNAAYRSARPNLNVVEATALPLTSDLGLNAYLEQPGAAGQPAALLKSAVWDANKLAIVLGVGNLTPNLSHFSSQKIWYTADPSQKASEGWLGKYFDEDVTSSTDEPFAGLGASASLPLALRSPTIAVPAISSVNAYQLQSSFGSPTDANLRRAKVPLLYQAYPTGLPFGLVLEDTAASATATSAALVGQTYTPATGVVYPNSGLGNGLKLIAQVLTANLGLRVAYVSTGGWDTHSTQLTTMQTLLTGLSQALTAFYKDISAKGFLNKVMIMTTSEFGRRVKENGSAGGGGNYGTDHGTANFQFFIGGAVRGGIYGAWPSLSSLDSGGNMYSNTDFRQTYATAISSWLGADHVPVLGASYNSLDFIGTVGSPQVFLPLSKR